jgi:hypothetical protein
VFVSCIVLTEACLVSPTAAFSVRHPKLAKCLPAKLTAYLDLDAPAPEHFAVPWLSMAGQQRLALFLAISSVVLLVLAIGLSVWQGIYSLQHPSRVFIRALRGRFLD